MLAVKVSDAAPDTCLMAKFRQHSKIPRVSITEADLYSANVEQR
jgi:hypothetical protein